MKQTFPFLMAATVVSFLFGCTGPKDLQMDITDVELVKIDTVQRYQSFSEKILTWRDENQVSYVTFVPLEAYYALGSRMKVMVKR
jgi:hypothetical protein